MSAVPMKDSGVEWLGEIPSNWDVRNFRFVARLMYGDSLKAEDRVDGDVPVFGSNGIVGYHTTANTTSPTIIVGRKGSFGKVNYSDVPAFAIDTTYFIDGYATSEDLRWLQYLLRILNLDASSKDSAVPGLSREDVYAYRLPLPPLAEQRAIAAYLDRETAKIDALIASTEKLNALLGEKRTALISHAVTRGLNPSVEMKDSGVEWLGEIPGHWEIVSLRQLAQSFHGGATPSTDKPENWNGDIPWVTSAYIGKDLYLHASAGHITEKGLRGSATRLVPKGNLLIGTRVGVGKVAINALDIAISQDLTAMIVNSSKAHAPFLARTIGSENVQSQFVIFSRGSTIQGIPRPHVVNIPIPIPPLAEQHAIADYLDRETFRIDALIAKNDELIALLREKRTSLISAAVTGKIDLRHEA